MPRCCRPPCSSSTKIACRRRRFTCRSSSAEAETLLLEEWLSSKAGRKVRLVVPRRGEKRGLLELAARNADLAYQQRFNENTAANYDALETLRVVLSLPGVPRRIECFDISTIQGSETVASMVVCEDGRMRKGEYRKFKIRGSGLGARGSGSRSAVPRPSRGLRRWRWIGSACGRRERRVFEPRSRSARGWGPTRIE